MDTIASKRDFVALSQLTAFDKFISSLEILLHINKYNL